MIDHINIRRARNGFIVSQDNRLNAISSGPSETICEDSDAVLKALGELFEEMNKQDDAGVTLGGGAMRQYNFQVSPPPTLPLAGKPFHTAERVLCPQRQI